MNQTEKHDFKWWALSVHAVFLTVFLWAVFAMLFIPRLILGIAIAVKPKFNYTPEWVEKWARKHQNFYDKYLKL